MGVIAAQSIGEPGTQLTMRTFHIGGAAQRGAEQSAVEATSDGTVKIANRNVVANSQGVPVVMSRNCEIVLIDAAGPRARALPRALRRAAADRGGRARWRAARSSPSGTPSPCRSSPSGPARVEYADLIEGVNFFEETDPVTGLSSRVVREPVERAKNVNLRPRILLRGEGGEAACTQYFLQPASVLNVDAGGDRPRRRRAGAAAARILQDPRHHRRPAARGGAVRGAAAEGPRRSSATSTAAWSSARTTRPSAASWWCPSRSGDEPPTPREYLVPKGKHVSVQEGDYVKAGDPLVDGPRVPHDILRVLGVEALANYLVNEIQDVYRLQGVKINDKHIEVIVRQMLQKVEILDPGDTTFLVGEQVDRIEFDIENDKRIEAKERPARAEPVLQGITKARLQTNSLHLARRRSRRRRGCSPRPPWRARWTASRA